MLIRCPTCSSTYDLPAALFARPGRTLRCAQCRECWTVRGDGQPRNNVFALFEPELGPEIVAEARSMRRQPSPKASPRSIPRARIAGSLRRSWRHSATVASGVALLVIVMVGLARKEDVVRALPGSAPLYAAVGLPVNLRGLALADVHGTVETQDGAPPVLTLEGKISNLRRETTEVPRLRFTVRDQARAALYSWTAAAPKPNLGPGESMVFTSRLATPPQAGRDLVVSFADPAETPRQAPERR